MTYSILSSSFMAFSLISFTSISILYLFFDYKVSH